MLLCLYCYTRRETARKREQLPYTCCDDCARAQMPYAPEHVITGEHGGEVVADHSLEGLL